MNESHSGILSSLHDNSTLHNLSICCHCNGSENKLNEASLVTFSVQLTRAFVTSILLVVLLLCYSALRVLGRTIITCTATCVIPWIVFYSLYIFKSLTLVIFIGIILVKHNRDVELVNRIGFVIINVIQPIILMMNCLALNHEWNYRSPDYVDNPADTTNEESWTLKLRRLVCRVATIFICETIVTLALLIAVEVRFNMGLPIWLVYVWLIGMLIQRVTVCVMGVLVCTQNQNKPTVAAKILLLLGLIFLIVDDLPTSLLATGNFHPGDGGSCHSKHLSIYDIFQFMGIIGIILVFFFIRDQYKRVEEECKHHLLWDLERLLDGNTQERNDLLIK